MIEIKSGIPLPSITREHPKKEEIYPFSKMKVNDCFSVYFGKSKIERNRLVGRISSAARRSLVNISTRTIDEYVWVWRIS